MVCWSEHPKALPNSPPNSVIPYFPQGKEIPTFWNRMKLKHYARLGAIVFSLAAWWVLIKFFLYIAPFSH